MWGRIVREWKTALWIAFAGAVAGIGFGIFSGMAFWPNVVSMAVTGALVASVLWTAVKMALDL